jgi:hypothetical protein
MPSLDELKENFDSILVPYTLDTRLAPHQSGGEYDSETLHIIAEAVRYITALEDALYTSVEPF